MNHDRLHQLYNQNYPLDYNYVNVPCEIQTVVYLYEVRGDSLFQLGINSPNLSVNLGVTNQPYLSSYVTTIGELGVYKTILDSKATFPSSKTH